MSFNTEYCNKCGYLWDSYEDSTCPTCELIAKHKKDIKDIHKMTKIVIKATERRVVDDIQEMADDHGWDDFGLIEQEIIPRLRKKYGVKDEV